MIWWLDDPARTRKEQCALAELAESAPWLDAVRWRVGEGGVLTVDFDIDHGGTAFPLTMTYSVFHPNAPPTVTSRGGRRLSEHQYVSGSLCLEYRADNWETSITGAMMVESAQRLIAGEQGVLAEELPSAHQETAGQRVRNHKLRFLLTHTAAARLSFVPVRAAVELVTAERAQSGTLLTTVTDIDGVEGFGAWPVGVPATSKKAFAVRLPAGATVPAATQDALVEMLDGLALTMLCEQLQAPGEIDLVLLHDAESTFLSGYDGKDGPTFITCRTVLADDVGARVPTEYDALKGAKVGIVGCGSLGSKVAAMLVRGGLRRLFLVDDDLMFAGNIARHELGARSVGLHKVLALKERLSEIVGELDVVTRAVGLGGQESAEATGSVMAALEACDVIIDATADPHCFNFCAAAARAGSRPMAWAEVFGGGIGGLVARVRPGLEPDPQTARNRIEAWCHSHEAPAPGAGPGRYDATVGEDPPLIADDAEVTLISAHLSRFVIDLLTRPGQSAFPSPAYVIGLRQAWIFSAPFETWPIDLDGAAPWQVPHDPATTEEAIALLRELMPTAFDDNDQPAS